MTVYYVSTTGNDTNVGTILLPWKTIQKASNTVLPGDIVYIRGGTYNEKVTITRSGTSGNYITFANYPTEIAVVDANGLVGNFDAGILLNSASWIKIIGLNVINSAWWGIGLVDYNGTYSNVIIQNNTISNIERSGFLAQNGSYITFDGNTVTQTQTAGNLGGQQNENVTLESITNFEIMNNHIYNTANFESIDAKGACQFGLIHNNDISPTASAGIYVDSRTGVTSNIDIYNNIIRGGTISFVRGIALAVEVIGGTLTNCKVYNNIVYDCGASGIVPGAAYSVGAVDNIQVVNNTVYNNGLVDNWGGGILVEYPSATNIVLRNNICYQNGARGDIITNANTIQDHNLTANPLFVNPLTNDFHLQAGSTAINTGSSTQFVPSFDYDGIVRPQGIGYDIGAYEYIDGGQITDTLIRDALIYFGVGLVLFGVYFISSEEGNKKEKKNK